MSSDARERRVANAAEARELLRAWSSSGEPMSSWCRMRGISWHSLSAYKGWSAETRDGFVEVETAAVVRTRPASVARYRVVLGDRVVEVGEDFDDEVLGRIVRVVETC